MMTTKGTKEWADSNVNICIGCSNDCIYCYAKGMAKRFRKDVYENWKDMKINPKAVSKGYGKRKGRVMFPTSHDITSENLYECIVVLRKLLKAGNDVLITTKPSLEVIKTICGHLELGQLATYEDQVQFRFTITSHFDGTLVVFEPNAPGIRERFFALRYAFDAGFKTSVSIEPFLDDINEIPSLIFGLQTYVTESIWIGPMNRKFCPKGFWNDDKWGKEALVKLFNLIKDNKVLDHGKIKYKDSFLNLIGKSG